MWKVIGVVLVLAGAGIANGANDVGAAVFEDKAATTQGGTQKSEMAVKDGLGVTVEGVKKAFKPDEPLVLKVTYKNVGKEPMRLPDVGGKILFWRLRLEDTVTGKRFTGMINVSAGLATPAGAIQPVTLKAGESLKVKAVISRFGFVEGDLTGAEFRAALLAARGGRRGGAAPGRGPMVGNNPMLPEGTYKLRVEIGFAKYPEGGKVSPDVADARKALQADPVPMWKGELIESNPVEVAITIDAPPLGLTAEDKKAAKEVVGLVTGWREKDADFLRAHGTVETDLARLEDAASAVVNDDGKDAKVGASRLADYEAALRQTAAQAAIVKGRATERLGARAKAEEMEGKLQEVGNR